MYLSQGNWVTVCEHPMLCHPPLLSQRQTFHSCLCPYIVISVLIGHSSSTANYLHNLTYHFSLFTAKARDWPSLATPYHCCAGLRSADHAYSFLGVSPISCSKHAGKALIERSGLNGIGALVAKMMLCYLAQSIFGL